MSSLFGFYIYRFLQMQCRGMYCYFHFWSTDQSGVDPSIVSRSLMGHDQTDEKRIEQDQCHLISNWACTLRWIMGSWAGKSKSRSNWARLSRAGPRFWPDSFIHWAGPLYLDLSGIFSSYYPLHCTAVQLIISMGGPQYSILWFPAYCLCECVILIDDYLACFTFRLIIIVVHLLLIWSYYHLYSFLMDTSYVTCIVCLPNSLDITHHT